MKHLAITTVFIVLLLTGCASVRNEAEVAAKQFLPLPDTAALYLVRDDSGEAARGPLNVFISLGGEFETTKCAEKVTQLYPHRFSRVELPAGQHEVVGLYLAKPNGYLKLFKLPIEVKPGQAYYVQTAPGYGLKQDTDTEPVKQIITGYSMVGAERLDKKGTMLLARAPEQTKVFDLANSVQVLKFSGVNGRVLYLHTMP